jgi:hypothetical protein
MKADAKRKQEAEMRKEIKRKQRETRNIVCWPFCYSIPDEEKIERQKYEEWKLKNHVQQTKQQHGTPKGLKTNTDFASLSPKVDQQATNADEVLKLSNNTLIQTIETLTSELYDTKHILHQMYAGKRAEREPEFPSYSRSLKLNSSSPLLEKVEQNFSSTFTKVTNQSATKLEEDEENTNIEFHEVEELSHKELAVQNV